MTTSSVRSIRIARSTELWSFLVIGALCTAAYAILYTLLRHGGVAPGAANALSLAATMGANFAANRRFTFRAAGEPLGRQLAVLCRGLRDRSRRVERRARDPAVRARAS